MAALALSVDEREHALECARFDRLVIGGPNPADCILWVGAIGADGYGRYFIYRGGRGMCVRPHRHALARKSGGHLEAGVLALHECDSPLCVKVCTETPLHVVPGTQSDNMRRMARMRRGGGGIGVRGGGMAARRATSVALRTALLTHGWDRDAVDAARLGDELMLW